MIEATKLSGLRAVPNAAIDWADFWAWRRDVGAVNDDGQDKPFDTGVNKA
jgi:hypothetical protein